MTMGVYRHTLLREGSSDANLIPVLDWLLRERGGLPLVQGQEAKPDRLPKKSEGLAEQIVAAVRYFGGDLLFIHRDADREPPDRRHDQIRREVEAARQAGFIEPAVAVVPVRMMEAWMLFDETAIRKASGNPAGKISLNLPPLRKLEGLPDPKSSLKQALERASELRGRHLKKFLASRAVRLIPDFITDFSPLRQLPSFQRLEGTIDALRENRWQPGFYG